MKHIYDYFAPPTKKSDTSESLELDKYYPGPRKFGAFSQSLNDFIPILGNDGNIFCIISTLKWISNVIRTSSGADSTSADLGVASSFES